MREGRSRFIVVNPYDYDRILTWEAAVCLCEFLMKRNHIDMIEPEISRLERDTYGLFIGGRSNPRIQIDLHKTRVPVRVPGYQWSYTGWKADLTGPGVLAHEMGHYVDAMLGYPSNRKRFRRIIENESPVSSYEPDRSEAFAESFKLFTLNPSLLASGRPLRWEYLTTELNLSPVSNVHWSMVLANAHPRIHNAAMNWINKH